MATIPITKRGAEKLKEELHRLKTVDRPWVINAIAEARAQGDLSENAEYDAAKDRQGFIEGRIAEIESKLSAAQVIDPSSLDAGGNILTLDTVGPSFSGDGSSAKYQDIIEFKSADHRTLSSQVLGEDGKWRRFMTANYRRRP